MAYREDRSVSFFGEEAYQTVINAAQPLEIQPQICSFSNLFRKLMSFCSKTNEPTISSQEPSSELFTLRTKYKSTVNSTFCSNRRTESPDFSEKKKEESFLRCYTNFFPKDEFFILEHKPFDVIAKYHEIRNLEKMEAFLLKKISNEGVLGFNFQICGNQQNYSFCKKVTKFSYF